jgi:hypothetical protein
MESDDPTGWPADDGDGWLADPDDIPGSDLGHDPQVPDYAMADPLSGQEIPETDLDEVLPDRDPDDGDPAAIDEPAWTDGSVLTDEVRDDQPTLGHDPDNPVPGTDPDVSPLADDESWNADPFPQALTFDQPPEPVDGLPWIDPSLLGEGDGVPLPDPAAGLEGPPPVADLYAYDAAEHLPDDPDPWASLAGSDDPATSSLARFWSPDEPRP